jgi:hypothetical protein
LQNLIENCFFEKKFIISESFKNKLIHFLEVNEISYHIVKNRCTHISSLTNSDEEDEEDDDDFYNK